MRIRTMFSPSATFRALDVPALPVLALLLVGFFVAQPQIGLAAATKSLPVATAAAVDQAIVTELEAQGIVGAAVGIIQDGEIVYLKGYGQADRENRKPVTQRTVFNWASNSKPLAAVAALQLVVRNKLNLDEDVRKYVPEFPDKGVKITMRDLLCHQSGIPHYANGLIVPTNRRRQTARDLLDPIHALDKFNQSPLLFNPGEKTSYSSFAFILVSAVIQRAGGEPFDKQITERIAAPLGMTSLQLDLESGKPNWAAGYQKNEDGKVIRASDRAHYWKHGAGGYKSDIKDFARWAQALINRKLISEEGEKLMWTRQTTTGGEKTIWGLGFTVDDQNELVVEHGGQQEETKTQLEIHPAAKNGIVLMSNSEFADLKAVLKVVKEALKKNG